MSYCDSCAVSERRIVALEKELAEAKAENARLSNLLEMARLTVKANDAAYEKGFAEGIERASKIPYVKWSGAWNYGAQTFMDSVVEGIRALRPGGKE